MVGCPHFVEDFDGEICEALWPEDREDVKKLPDRAQAVGDGLRLQPKVY
jgi:hypothetical protein